MSIVSDRLENIRKQLLAGHDAGDGLSSATKGNEREQFVTGFLTKVFPSQFRFGSGDIVDTAGVRSGQLDLVIEYPFGQSFAAVGAEARLYPAEGVATVVEVKSNVANQREQVLATAKLVKSLSPVRVAQFVVGDVPQKIPVVAVGFGGWAKENGACELVASTYVDAVYEIEAGRVSCTHTFAGVTAPGTHWREGPEAMLWLLHGIRRSIAHLMMADVPLLHYR